MEKKKQREKGRKWDGRSRVSTDKYKKGWNEIFGSNTTVEHERDKHRESKDKTHG